MALGYFFLFPQVIRCYAIDFSDFTKHPNRIYTSQGTSETQKKALFALLSDSDKRISRFWGSKQSKPAVIFCHSERVYQEYGSRSGSPANFFGTPVGAYVIISPNGLNADVISHEMGHAELTQRVGWLTMTIQVPQWFNEGLALMLDYRFPDGGINNSYKQYRRKWKEATYGGQYELPLEELTEVDKFFKGDSYSQYLAYLRSGLEVSRWLEKADQRGLLLLVEKVEKGEKFDAAYKEIEQMANQ
jgi:hypothetical protein